MDETYGNVFTDGTTSWFAIPNVGVFVSSVGGGVIHDARLTLQDGKDQVRRGFLKEVVFND